MDADLDDLANQDDLAEPLRLHACELVDQYGFGSGWMPGAVMDRFHQPIPAGTYQPESTELMPLWAEWRQVILPDLVRFLLLPTLPVAVTLGSATDDNPLRATRVGSHALDGLVRNEQGAPQAVQDAEWLLGDRWVDVPMRVICDFMAVRSAVEGIHGGPEWLLRGLMRGQSAREAFAGFRTVSVDRAAVLAAIDRAEAMLALRESALWLPGDPIPVAWSGLLVDAGWTPQVFGVLAALWDQIDDPIEPRPVMSFLWESDADVDHASLPRLAMRSVLAEAEVPGINGVRMGDPAVFLPWLSVLCSLTDESRARWLYSSFTEPVYHGRLTGHASKWQQRLGPVAPWAYATGMTLDEAIVEQEAGRLGLSEMQVLANLQGVLVPSAITPADDDATTPPA